MNYMRKKIRQFEEVINILEGYKNIGYRELENGTRLIGHVPHVASEAWLHSIYPSLDEDDITNIEGQIFNKLPNDFHDFLRLSNGLNIFSDTLSIDGLRRSYVRVGDEAIQPYHIRTTNVYERPEDSRDSYVYIGGYNWDGSLLYIDDFDGHVYRCTRESSVPLNKWENFWVMLLEETKRISRLFDERGREIDPEKPTTPTEIK